MIDLEQHKIVKTADMPLEDERSNRLSFEVSPDGKYLYQFGPKIKILQTVGLQAGGYIGPGATGFQRSG